MQYFQIVFEQERFDVRRYNRLLKERKAQRERRDGRYWQSERIQKCTPFTLP